MTVFSVTIFSILLDWLKQFIKFSKPPPFQNKCENPRIYRIRDPTESVTNSLKEDYQRNSAELNL